MFLTFISWRGDPIKSTRNLTEINPTFQIQGNCHFKHGTIFLDAIASLQDTIIGQSQNTGQ